MSGTKHEESHDGNGRNGSWFNQRLASGRQMKQGEKEREKKRKRKDMRNALDTDTRISHPAKGKKQQMYRHRK